MESVRGSAQAFQVTRFKVVNLKPATFRPTVIYAAKRESATFDKAGIPKLVRFFGLAGNLIFTSGKNEPVIAGCAIKKVNLVAEHIV